MGDWEANSAPDPHPVAARAPLPGSQADQAIEALHQEYTSSPEDHFSDWGEDGAGTLQPPPLPHAVAADPALTPKGTGDPH